MLLWGKQSQGENPDFHRILQVFLGKRPFLWAFAGFCPYFPRKFG
jgi:hypothetical protein